MKKIITSFLAAVIVFVILFIGNALIKEKYCYNNAFISLDSRGIKLGEADKGYSPLQVKSIPGSNEWESVYVDCYKNFDLLNLNFSTLSKSYPQYEHFIDW